MMNYPIARNTFYGIIQVYHTKISEITLGEGDSRILSELKG